jgi:hypothetical protein
MITLGIKGGRESQHVGGAELHAERAAFTAFHVDGNETFGHENPP